VQHGKYQQVTKFTLPQRQTERNFIANFTQRVPVKELLKSVYFEKKSRTRATHDGIQKQNA